MVNLWQNRNVLCVCFFHFCGKTNGVLVVRLWCTESSSRADGIYINLPFCSILWFHDNRGTDCCLYMRPAITLSFINTTTTTYTTSPMSAYVVFEVLATSSKSKFSQILNTVASSPETRELSCKTKLQLSAPATWKIKWESVSDLSELIIEFTFFLIGPV